MAQSAQSPMFVDPCGGTGILSYVKSNGTTVAARCLCARGQLRISLAIPLITEVVEVWEHVQDLFPDGLPEILTFDDIVDVPRVGRVRKNRRRHIQSAYAEGVRDGKRG